MERHVRMKSGFFTPRWIITTLLVIAAVLGMVRLGIWQLDRLEQRREFNTRVSAQVSAPELDLNQADSTVELVDLEYRPVVVRGEYDPAHEIILRNQVYENQPGYHLLTPLRIAGSDQSILVDRGFIPMEDGAPQVRVKYQQSGQMTVRGVLRLPHVPKFAGVPDPTLAPGETRLDAWNAINLDRIRAQVPYALLPVYLQADAGSAEMGFPVGKIDSPDLSEGSHLSYAFQWFTFAALLGGGYPFFVKKQLKGTHQ
jgi:surfeit locus 1 family protein